MNLHFSSLILVQPLFLAADVGVAVHPERPSLSQHVGRSNKKGKSALSLPSHAASPKVSCVLMHVALSNLTHSLT
jgi:hypothetical protein